MGRIALIILDTLRTDAFRTHFSWLDGLRFTNAVSTSHWTIPALASIFTGRYPSEVGVHAKSQSLDVSAPVLPEILQAAGFRTRAVITNMNLAYQDGWRRGFDEFHTPWETYHEDAFDTVDQLDQDSSTVRGYVNTLRTAIAEDKRFVRSGYLGLRALAGDPPTVADDGAKSVLEWIRNSSFADTEFLLVNLMEAHGPYDPPPSHNSAGKQVGVTIDQVLTNGVADPEVIRTAYHDAVAYLAHVYKPMFRELISEFDFVITCSDHGELLGEHGLWNHGVGLYPELIRVPLVISGGGLEGEVDAICSLKELFDTILDIAGVPTADSSESLLELGERHVDRSDTDFLVESHGLTRWQRSRFERKDVHRTRSNRTIRSSGRLRRLPATPTRPTVGT